MKATQCRQRQLVLELTEQCNNSCLHCYNFWRGSGSKIPPKQVLSRLQIKKLIQKVRLDAPIINIALSGGEPMLRKDIAEIVCDIVECNLSPLVITNGVLLNEKNLKKFPVNTAFEITLFSAYAKIHNQIAGNNVFDIVLNNLSRINKRGSKFFLAFVVTKKNAGEIKKTIELAIALGAGGALINRINLSKNSMSFASEIVPSVNELHDCLYEADKLAGQYSFPISISVPIPPCLINPDEFPNLHFGWCPRGNQNSYYTIGTTGLLRSCNHSSIILGDLFTQTYDEIVNSYAAKKFWSTIPEFCIQCNHPLKNVCSGGCPAAAYECYGTNSRIDPFVEFSVK
jgi:radical SAM protein with 4Fe4S-binding SPASM domain